MTTHQITLNRAELCLLLCALSEATAVTMEAQMSADEAQFKALDRTLDLYLALRRKLRLFEDGANPADQSTHDAYEATDRTAWVGDLEGATT
jgi:hypothetical protein